MEEFQTTHRAIGLSDLAARLAEQQHRKRDMVVPTSLLAMLGGALVIGNAGPSKLGETLAALNISGSGEGSPGESPLYTLATTTVFDEHLAERLGIPLAYLRRMKAEDPRTLLDDNVNYWLSRLDRNVLVRTFVEKNPDGTDGPGGIARALLSDSYKVIDNVDILYTALEALQGSGHQVVIESCDLTDRRMYVRVACPAIERESRALLDAYRRPGDGGRTMYGDDGPSVIAGMVFGNSEVGNGAFFAAPRLIVKRCSNGLVVKRDGIRRAHVGSKLEEGTINWSQETRTKNLELIMAQLRDAVTTYFSAEYVGRVIEELETKGTRKLEHPVDAVENVASALKMSDQRKLALVNAFMDGGVRNAFGLVQAVTWVAHEVGSGDEQYEMENAALGLLDQVDALDRKNRN